MVKTKCDPCPRDKLTEHRYPRIIAQTPQHRQPQEIVALPILREVSRAAVEATVAAVVTARAAVPLALQSPCWQRGVGEVVGSDRSLRQEGRETWK